MASLLRDELRGSKWRILNDTPLPLICFAPDEEELSTPDKLAEIARRVLESGEAWISVTRIGGRAALRACITNFRTNNKDVYALATVVSKARQHITASAGV
jgi:glutamate/tyrosine decarboxylase-like PLP-dependent enzyme